MNQFTSIILLIALFLCHQTIAQKKKPNPLTAGQTDSLTHIAVQQKTNEIFDSLVSIRRNLHVYPELSGQERRTSKKIEQYLSSLGLEVKTNIGGFGVVGILNGAKKGKKIAWRADIDALASDIPDVVDFNSKHEGIRHICGHDVHTTVALGIANVLASQKEHLSGTVYFVFQPSEENLKGAQAMMDDGLFDLVSPDEMYALHMSPFPKGTIATKSEGLFADYKKIKVSLKKSSDMEEVISFTKKQIASLQSVPAESEFWDPMNMGHPEMGIASPNTIYKDYILVSNDFKVEEKGNEVYVSNYISSSDRKQQDTVVPFLKKQFSNSEYADELVSIAYLPQTPTILNDEELVTETMGSIASIYGQENVITLSGVISDGRSDDFALFQERVPGVYFFLGGSNYEANVISFPHAPDFAVDEECIKTGVQFFSSMIIERLSDK